jgi:hypothetical protein
MRTIMFGGALCMALCTTAFADPSSAADKRVGIGLGVGVATGPNLQLMTSSISHVDVGMGLYYDDWLRIQADHAWRVVNLSSARSISLPLYLGVGGFVTDRRFGTSEGGLRMPFGIQADFARAPIQLFGELSPELAVVQVTDDRMAQAPEPLAITGLMGVRAAF